VLFFGFIRDYKGIETLLEASEKVSRDKFHFHFVGEPWSRNLEMRILSAAEKHQNITQNLSYVSHEKLLQTFASTDILVLPYLKATGSGALATAKGMGAPVIISNAIHPGADFVTGRDGLTFPSGDSAGLASSLEYFRDNRREFVDCWLDLDLSREWSEVSKKLISNF
jgi:glycosyltransferase involved in cell wall biosynthesis